MRKRELDENKRRKKPKLPRRKFQKIKSKDDLVLFFDDSFQKTDLLVVKNTLLGRLMIAVA